MLIKNIKVRPANLGISSIAGETLSPQSCSLTAIPVRHVYTCMCMCICVHAHIHLKKMTKQETLLLFLSISLNYVLKNTPFLWDRGVSFQDDAKTRHRECLRCPCLLNLYHQGIK